MCKCIFPLLLILIPCCMQGQNNYAKEGNASFYADKFEGRKTANGEIYSHSKLTGAHLTLPFNTYVKVTNLTNEKSVTVRINDRGPFVQNRIIDLSKSAAQILDFIEIGVVKVCIEIVENPSPSLDTKEEISAKTPEKEDISTKKKTYESIVTKKEMGIQVGSFKDKNNAINTSKELKDTFQLPVKIQTTEINNTKQYRVIIGSFEKRHNAEKLKKTLSQKYPDCFIVSY